MNAKARCDRSQKATAADGTIRLVDEQQREKEEDERRRPCGRGEGAGVGEARNPPLRCGWRGGFSEFVESTAVRRACVVASWPRGLVASRREASLPPNNHGAEGNTAVPRLLDRSKRVGRVEVGCCGLVEWNMGCTKGQWHCHRACTSPQCHGLACSTQDKMPGA